MSDEAIKAQKRALAAGKRAEASHLSSQVNTGHKPTKIKLIRKFEN